MAAFGTTLQPFLAWLLETTIVASVVICLILVLQKLLGRRLGPRWSHALWLVLLLRMVLPWTPPSPVSLFRLVPASLLSDAARDITDSSPHTDALRAIDSVGLTETTTVAARTPAGTPDGPTKPRAQEITRTAHPSIPLRAGLRRMLPLLWLVGAVLLAGHLAASNFALWRIIKREHPLTEQPILELFEQCKTQMGVQTIVALVSSERVRTAALFGFVRPRLLMPRQMLDTATPQEMRYVFLHELAHLKRHDIYLGWLTSLLQVLHWFNPLVWFAFYRMRSDRELACDALVLTRTKAEESHDYGRTMVGLLGRFSCARPLPAMAGILESKSQLKRRITMIAQFKNNSYRWSPLAVTLVVVLSCASLPDAGSRKAAQPSAANPTGVSASQAEETTGLAPDRNAPVAPPVTSVSATETASRGGGLVLRRVLADASGIDGVLTAEGRYISHIDPKTGDMVQFEVASGQTSRITNKGGAAARETPYEYQVFSRDGQQIAYDSYTKDWVPQLRIRNLDGSGLRTLYSEKGRDVHPMDWSPDAGSILAFRELEKGYELTLISTADGSVRVLRTMSSGVAFNDWYYQRASFSPDGRFIAFSFMREGSPPVSEVFLMTTDGRNEIVVAAHPTKNRLLGWTPDGRSLLFSSGRSGTWDLWSVRITDGKQHGEPGLLTKEFPSGRVIGLAPNGSLYSMTRISSGRLYNGEVDLETGKVLVPPAPVATRYTSPQNFLTWSPDGRNLAYLSHPGPIGTGNNILTIRSATTGEERFLSPDLRGVNQISWAPDGRSIIALGFTETGTGAYRIDTETSEITRLADGGVFARLCPDGKTLVFYDGAGGIGKRNLDTGETSMVVKAAPSYTLSPDGREVAFQEKGVVKTMSLNGGEPRELFRGSARYYGLQWTRDGRYIIVWTTDPTGSEIWRVPAQGGTPLKLDISFVPKMAFFALHPDNRRFAFSVREGSKSELWVLENFLPVEVGK
jgi:beta-lactamase regulating signal transducer with metallopeptidase domain/Tol biopolymer transport system component